MYEESIRAEFTHQTDTFARAGALKAAQTLGALVELAPADPEARWLEVACGPAMVGRELAPKVGSVCGVDLTPAMIEKAREEADREDLGNVEFALGDATALEFEHASFDGAITRWSLHHIPVPQRVVEHLPQRIMTAAGVSSGIDMALRLVELLVGRDAAEASQLMIEYDPQPPFDCGSVDKTDDVVMTRVIEYAQLRK